jgi:hypothetical protein
MWRELDAVADWVHAAATTTAAQLTEAGAQPHSVLGVQLAAAIGLTDTEQTAIGDVLDLVQVATDLADNLADQDEDDVAARPWLLGLADIPAGAAQCLPALLIAEAVRRSQTPRAREHLVRVLAAMTYGQGSSEDAVRIDYASGHQARLLLLPWYVRETPREQLEALERWAIAFGRTWELTCRLRESPGPESREALLAGRAAAEAVWPTCAPFRDGELMDVRRVWPRGIS